MNQDPKVTPYKKGEGGILKHAAEILKKQGYISIRLISDPFIRSLGVFSIEYPKFFLNAKAYRYRGSIVSIQKNIVEKAKILKKDIVIYVAQDNVFYIFDPQIILNNSWEDVVEDPEIKLPDGKPYRHVRSNWDVNLGRNLLL